jgi:hypothetical protein
MDLRHQEFMAMADTYLGPRFNRGKLAETEALQLALHEAQGALAGLLDRQQIDRRGYFEALNNLQVSIARQCVAILGTANFVKLFGVDPSEVAATLDKEIFLGQS